MRHFFKVLLNYREKKAKKLKLFGNRVEHVLVDHVAAGIVQPCTFLFFLDHCHKREFHTDTGHVTEHLLELDLLGVHEERVGDFCRAEFLALAAVHAGVRDMGEPYEVEHEVGRELPWRDIGRVLCGTIDTIANRAGLNT
jgi:hypothetical protein